MEQTALLSNLLRVASASSHQQLLLTAGHGDGFMAVLTRRRCRQAAGEPEQDEVSRRPRRANAPAMPHQGLQCCYPSARDEPR